MELTYLLAQKIEETGFHLITEPQLNIINFQDDELSVWEIADILEDKGWAVSISSYPQAVRIIIMPHIKREHIEAFVQDLKSINRN